MKQTLMTLLLLLTFAGAQQTVVNVNYEDDDTATIEQSDFNSDYLYIGKGLTFGGAGQALFFLGETLNLTGSAENILVAGGRDLNITGATENGILGGGKSVNITGKVRGTSFIAGRDIVVKESADVQGDLFLGASEITIDAPVAGNLYLGSGKTVINSEIDGDVHAYSGRVLIGEKGKILGDFTYTTEEKMAEEGLARVVGTVTYKEPPKEEETPKQVFAALGSFLSLFCSISFLLIGTVFISFPVARGVNRDLTADQFWKTAGWGLIPIFMYPAVVLIGFVGVITIPLSIMLILLFCPLFFVALVIGATMVGKRLSIQFNWNVERRQYHFLIGAVVFTVVSLIPVIDFVAIMILFSLGWGVMIDALFVRTRDAKIVQPAGIDDL